LIFKKLQKASFPAGAISLYKKMLQIRKKIHESQTPDEKEIFIRIADKVGEQIDELVY